MADVFTAKGLEGAQAVTQMLAILAAAEAGADWLTDPRSDSKNSNAEIVQFLANGNTRGSRQAKRDIRTTSEENTKMAEIFMDEFVRQLNMVKHTQSTAAARIESRAKAATIGGLRKAALFRARIMLDHIKNRTVAGGGGAEPVTEAYGKQRERKYGVSPKSVYVASGQLATAAMTKRIKFRFNTGKIGAVLKAVKANR